MDSLALDPYEQQLLSVFASYDRENVGSLDRDGLSQLCQTLQLDEQTPDLIKSLLKDPKRSRATFAEFKDALLTLLGNMQHDDLKKIENSGSPDREVSPKFVYGSKKYGRRSRPRSDEIFEDLNKSPNSTMVQRSNSQTEVSSKKRKTNYKLKRCTSLPATQKIDFSQESDFGCTEEMLREAWRKLGVGEDGYLNQTELALVCDAIGLHKLANGVIRQLSDKQNFDFDHKISFQELLEALQLDETWTEVLNTSPNTTDLTITNELFPDSRTFQYITLGPDGNGLISTETLIEMWELVGISSPKELIAELGFGDREINIVELAAVLDKEIKGGMENPHLALIHANLTLYQCEIRCLKNVIEQMHAEREKLKCDVIEANNRAKLLAQEVDDNHIKMERNSQNQVKLMEQRHSDILREVTEQYSNDKEHLTTLNLNLEKKIQTLELEVGKLKNDLIVAQKFSNTLEKENLNLTNQITELRQAKSALTNQINGLENEKQKYVEMEQEQIEPLLAKLSNLQLENAQLRDKNDEMVAEIESLTSQMARTKAKSLYNSSALDENISTICEGVGLGAKRRSDYSPTKDDVLFGIADSSPRLGKVRKFQKNSEVGLPFSSNESGVGADLFDTSVSGEEVTRLQAKIAFLEQILRQHQITVPSDAGAVDDETSELAILKARVFELEQIFTNLGEISKMINKNGLNSDNIKLVSNKIEQILAGTTSSQPKQVDACIETDPIFEETIAKNEELRTKCSELENCLELLRNEYEKCEDYWQSKLDEERQIFEQEQGQSSEKLTDLINKMAEYEEQLTVDNRLPPIEETYNLEKQFTDLEQEFEEYKIFSENEIFKRDEEISVLREKLAEFAKTKDTRDACTQSDLIGQKMSNLSLCVVESTNLFSADAVPWSPTKEQKSNDSSLSWQQASTSNSSTLSTPCRPKRTRKHERNNCLYKKNQEKKNEESFVNQEVVSLPVSTIHGLNGRLHHLEQRCRQLQMVLKQQHFYTEQALQQCRQHHRGEKAELQCILRGHQEKLEQQVRICNDQLERLARSDMLVKELYVENSYLIAKVQRLEQQCHILAQCNSNSTSV